MTLSLICGILTCTTGEVQICLVSFLYPYLLGSPLSSGKLDRTTQPSEKVESPSLTIRRIKGSVAIRLTSQSGLQAVIVYMLLSGHISSVHCVEHAILVRLTVTVVLPGQHSLFMQNPENLAFSAVVIPKNRQSASQEHLTSTTPRNWLACKPVKCHNSSLDILQLMD